jgi:hypothetical protein
VLRGTTKLPSFFLRRAWTGTQKIDGSELRWRKLCATGEIQALKKLKMKKCVELFCTLSSSK